jgi:hypothetical protein
MLYQVDLLHSSNFDDSTKNVELLILPAGSSQFEDNCYVALNQTLERLRDQIISLQIQSSSSNISFLDEFLKYSFVHSLRLRNLRRLQLSSIEISQECLKLICNLLNPSKCALLIQSVSITNCSLGSLIIELIQSLHANMHLLEIDFNDNNAGDISLLHLDTCLTGFENRVQSLNWGYNGISDRGVEQLTKTLASRKVTITTLYLGNNPQITSSSMDTMFQMIVERDMLETLSLYGCSLSSCNWASYLPFIRSLADLDLSHNLLHDDDLVKLCHGLKWNTSIRSLNIANNRFTGFGTHSLETLLSENGSLFYLSIRSNVIEDKTAWKSIALGLAQNHTLRQLDLSDCGLVDDDILMIASIALTVNSVTDIVMEDSLTQMDTDNLRDYLQFYKPEMKVLPLSSTYELDGLHHRHTWVEIMRAKIQSSIEAASLVNEDGTVKESVIHIPAEEFSRMMWYKNNIVQSSYWLTEQQLTTIVEDLRQLYSNQKQTIQIAFGRRDFIIGTIDIDVHISYHNLRVVLQPLIDDYAKGVTESERESLQNYSILNVHGDSIENDILYQVRIYFGFIIIT